MIILKKKYRRILPVVCFVTLSLIFGVFYTADAVAPNDNKAQSQDPLNYLKSGFSYLQQNKLDEAKAYCEKAIALISNPASQVDKNNLLIAHDMLAVIYGKQNKLDMAIDELKKCLSLNPNSDSTYYKMGIIYAQRGMNSEAKEALQKVIDIGNKGESKGVLATYAKQALEKLSNR